MCKCKIGVCSFGSKFYFFICEILSVSLIIFCECMFFLLILNNVGLRVIFGVVVNVFKIVIDVVVGLYMIKSYSIGTLKGTFFCNVVNLYGFLYIVDVRS